MNNRIKIFSIMHLIISSVTVLVMLVESFEHFNEKYLPSFMLGQKFALPIILTALAFVFLVFFEPERLERRSNMLVMKLVMIATVLLFFFFITTLQRETTSPVTLAVYFVQLLSTITATFFFLTIKTKN